MTAIAPTQTITFESKHRDLRIIRVSQEEIRSPTGAYITSRKPMRYVFREGRLDVEVGQDMLPDGPPVIGEDGRAERYEDGRVKLQVQDAVHFLRSRPGYNNTSRPGGFTEVGREPNRIPDAGPVIDQVMEAFGNLDRDTLVAIREAEEAAEYTRQAVLDAVASALPRVEGALDALAARDRLGGTPQGTTTPGTPENGGDGGQGDDLAGLGMNELRRIGSGLGLTFGVGTSKDDARDQIRAKLAEG
jgi:hypothetical protein